MADRRTMLGLTAMTLVIPILVVSAAKATERINHEKLIDSSLKRPVMVFVAGDSTASTWPAKAAPQAGWGQALALFFVQSKARVDNRALSRASSKSFIDVGRFDALFSDVQQGDYVLISFGHNDEEMDARHTAPYTTYQKYLSKYIDEARSRGAHPVLITPAERRHFDKNGHILPSHGDYPKSMRELGEAKGVPVVDLTAQSAALWNTLGTEGTKDHFLWLPPGQSPNFKTGSTDNTHFHARGAIALARLIVRDLVDHRIIPVQLTSKLDWPFDEDDLLWPEKISP